MKRLKKLILLAISIAFFSCASHKNTTNTSKVASTKFSIVQLNDVYEIAPIQGGKYGGMARVATVYNQVKKKQPNSMLVLAGDFLNPSLLGTMKLNGERVRGRQMVETMNAMGVDLVAFGNHEFDLGYKDLQKRINESKFNWISANVLHNVNSKSVPFISHNSGEKHKVGETYIKEFTNVDGSKLKVGFISVCIPSNPRDYVTYKDMFTEIVRSYNEVKPKVDIVIGLTHVSIEQDKKIAKLLPELPLIMGGHEHTNMKVKVGNVIITKADANTKTVYLHNFKYDRETKEVVFSSDLKEINDKIKVDPKVDEVVQKWQKILNVKIKEVIANPNEVIYHAKTPLDARDTPIRSIQTNMGAVITKAMSFAFDDTVDCALVNGGSIRIDDMLVGDINAVDIFRVLPYGGAILKVDIKGSLLKKVLDYGKKAAGTGAYLQRYNVKFKNDNWLIKDKAIEETKTYKVAFSDYLLKGLDIPILSSKEPEVLKVYQPKNDELAVDIRKAVVAYLKNI